MSWNVKPFSDLLGKTLESAENKNNEESVSFEEVQP